jgi:metal-responsive CopG/Arc/MetJ family transcriptional regulator
MLGNRMARRKIFEARVNLPITAELLARIDAALENDEYRVDFIRDAIKAELERRTGGVERKPTKRGRK